MMKSRFPYVALSVCLLLAGLSACRKQPDPVVATPVPAGPGAMSIEITNQVNDLAMQLGQWYQTPLGDSVNISAYKYYLTNISLTTITGQVYTEQESYHLIDQNKPESRAIELSNVPEGDYATIRFMIGVDSLRNTTGAQTGALDPKLGMIWSWNTGYIMAKMEGLSPSVPIASKQFFFHVGGFKGENNATRWVTLQLPATAQVKGSKKPNIHLTADMMQWFYGTRDLRLSEFYNIMGEGRNALNLANNYQNMFRVNHVD